MMSWFICHYPPRPSFTAMRNPGDDDLVGDYASFIWANSEKHAAVLARRRNIGEVVDGKWGSRRSKPYRLPSELLLGRRIDKKKALDAVHSTAFLCYLLMQSHEDVPPCDIVGDEGLLHQVIHSLSLGWPRRKDMAATLKYFELGVPGYVPR
jgi:hypothetical protein